MASDSDETNRLLGEILSAIQDLNQSFKKQERRVDNPEKVEFQGKDVQESFHPVTQDMQDLSLERIREDPPYFNAADERSRSPPIYQMAGEDRNLWTELIGDAWTLPTDQRIDLGFQKQSLEKMSIYDLELRLKEFQLFNDDLLGSKTPLDSSSPAGRNWFRHFTIEDTSSQPPYASQTYEIGRRHARIPPKIPHTDPAERLANLYAPRKAPPTGLKIRPNAFFTAPWQRLIFLYAAVDSHLSCERRDFERKRIPKPAGPSSIQVASTLTFHITFFEIYLHGSENTKDLWKVGKLYNDPQRRWFRECACTILARSSYQIIESTSRQASPEQYHHWTILHLTPEGFGKQTKAVGHMDLAVLRLVTTSLYKVAQIWSELVNYLRTLLESDNSLLDPTRHDHLLFDNEGFSKSREYFWAINCLTQFEASISANIEQWDEFRHHLEPLVDSEQEITVLPLAPGDGTLTELMARSDGYCARLKRYQKFFQDKRAATIALRDGLFNASSVMESRAATRLGENIKLLTFVSVFFLPLSFCTSIWSTQNGPSNPNMLIYVCIIVGFVTYMVVFNLNFIVRTCARTYEPYKDHLVQSMRREQSDKWRLRGKCYDVFRPVHEREQPTEWLVLWYIMWRASIGLWRSNQRIPAKKNVDAEEAEVL